LNNERRGHIKGMDLDGGFAQDLEFVKERLFKTELRAIKLYGEGSTAERAKS
jgi:hypothetical protein